MALCKHVVLALACVTMCVLAMGCADDAAAPQEHGEDEAPVLVPTNVRAMVLDDGLIRIMWDPSPEPAVRGYNVYRLDRTDETIRRLNASMLEGTRFLDRDARIGREYEYRVTSVGTGNRESGFAAVTIRNLIPNRKDGHFGEN